MINFWRRKDVEKKDISHYLSTVSIYTTTYCKNLIVCFFFRFFSFCYLYLWWLIVKTPGISRPQMEKRKTRQHQRKGKIQLYYRLFFSDCSCCWLLLLLNFVNHNGSLGSKWKRVKSFVLYTNIYMPIFSWVSTYTLKVMKIQCYNHQQSFLLAHH